MSGFGFDIPGVAARRKVTGTPTLQATKRLLWVGSSSEAARWTGTGTVGMTNARSTGYLMMAAKQLALNGVSVNDDSTFCDQNNENDVAHMTAYDARFGTISGLTVNTANSSMGGYPLRYAASTAGDYSITTVRPCTTISIYCQFTNAATTSNSLIYSIDGGTETSFTATNTSIRKFQITGLTSATHTLRIRAAATNAYNINLVGVEFGDSTAPQVVFMPAGARAWSSDPLLWGRTGGISPISMLGAMQCSAVLATFGGNESLSSSSTTADFDAFQARCTTWANAVVAAGGTPIFIAKPYMTAAYYTVTDALNASFNGIPTYQMGLISEAQAIAQGEKAADDLHYLAPWHAREGAGLGNWLSSTLLPALGWIA